MTKTFGQLFGELVRRYREKNGWSLAELAFRAWGNNDKDFVGQDRSAQVQRIEMGHAAKPQAKTIKAMQAALNIPQAEIDALRGREAMADAELVAALMDRNAVLAKDLHLNTKLVVEIARNYARSAAEDFDGALASIRVALLEAAKLRDKGEFSGDLDTQFRLVLERVRSLASEGELDAAMRALDADLLALAERKDALIQTENAAHVLGLSLAIQGNDPGRAASHIIARIALDHHADQFNALCEVQNDWYTRGRAQGNVFDLTVSIALAQSIVAQASTPDQRGIALNHLAIALCTCGEREKETERLDQAVAAYREALKVLTRDRVPLDWAMTQNNLGNALGILGQREAGSERLEQAVAAYREALKEWTRDRVPLDWSLTQSNLGNALQTLGAREEGLERLEQAVAAFREALQECTRDRAPLQWAMTQNNLGNTFGILGQRDTGTVWLNQAVMAYRETLQEWTRDRVPLDWAATQMNLGSTLRILGEREEGVERLDQAVAAYQEALKECTPDRAPLQWGMMQCNLAIVEVAYFDKVGGRNRLANARVYAYAAREVFVQSGATHYQALVDQTLDAISARTTV